MKLLLKGGRIVDPSQNIDETLDLLIEDGLVARIAPNLPAPEEGRDSGTAVVDLEGKTVVPGLFDMHTHLREPGHEYKETILSGTAAAVAGGFTAVACMANTNPVNDNSSVTDFILRKAARADLARVYPVAAVSRKLEGEILTEFSDLKDAGAVALSDDGNPVASAGLMRRALEYAHSLSLPVISHCEDRSLTEGGAMNESFVSTELGLPGIPTIAEDIMAARDIALAEYTGTTVHIAHVSTAATVELVRNAKRRGISVTAETAPHYFTLTDEALRSYSTDLKVYPPIRGPKDRDAVIDGLRDGTIDVIASDHAPHSSIEKDVEFAYAATGLIGLETSLGLSLAMVEQGVISISRLVEAMSVNPARILGVPGGTLRTGTAADVTVIDITRAWTVDKNAFRSLSRNCPFHGRRLTGKCLMTIVGGVIKYREDARLL
ncbi:MAG: dihydroorotase [delta proteobacterium MLS_D]|jgi:dihydroorotase|nr:MAG: dihydroorotase [delta proteobacterium MLS_D]